MQNAGTLKKRRRRQIKKVSTSAVTDHPEFPKNSQDIEKTPLVQNTENDTRIRIEIGKNYKIGNIATSRANSSRITRNPTFSDLEQDISTEEKSDYQNQVGHDQPYLFTKSVLNRLRVIVISGMLSANFPWLWNNKTKRIERWSPVMVKLWKMYWCGTVIQSICMLSYHIHCLNGMYSRNLESYRGIFAYSVILYFYACHLGYRASMFLYEDDMRRYINRLQDFNEEYVDKYLIYADKGTEFGAGRMVMNLSIPAAACNIANSLFLFLVTPSAPYYLTSMIKPLRWYSLIPGAFHELTLIGHTIITYLTISWLQVAHTSTMDFWLREMHKGIDSDYTSDNLRQPDIAVTTYRALQLMCTMFNDCMAPLCIPVWKFSVAFGFIPSGYIWIRSMNRLFIEEFPGVLLYPFGVINCITMGFGCIAMAAEMYDIANSFISSWSLTNQKDFKRTLMSCPTLKVKVGQYYSISGATAITFFQGLLLPVFPMDVLKFVSSVSKFYEDLKPDLHSGQQYITNVNDECYSYWFYYKDPLCLNICPLAGYLRLFTPTETEGKLGLDVVPQNVTSISSKLMSLDENSTVKTPAGNETVGEAVKRINAVLSKRLEICTATNFKFSPESNFPDGETPSDRAHCAIFLEADRRKMVIMSNCIMSQLGHDEQFKF
ncbi:hypothetical protein Ocin01_03690 [Orchesella cincta]|uniref:Uncharacterized protein n=1 Tax=Orchesella cincta TaxID=48709 RepID=A0A1D2NDD7_ORCCI|nr:hypothetical protein Ocin01_03690 [Orchesella cincta]